ncbi:MAG: extracellular solute-binding protein [Lachnospiraceae bacterium]|nr:extracellular solute-binding protein [bacterium]MDY5516707.1 extracellular solute-binding protein [Lachnospiraceae bacterium]
MKNTKKFLAIGMSVLMAASLVACGSASEETTPAQSEENVQAEDSQQTDKEKTEDSSTGEPVTVTFWNSFTGADGDMLVDLVNRFNEENKDNITVEMDISADFDSQLSTAFAAGTGPTMILSSSAYRFTYGDYLQNVSDVFDKTNLDKSDFIQSYLDYCSEGDYQYFVPFQIVGYYMYWNKDLFEAAGLDPETPPTTWEEWQVMAEKLTDESKNVYGSGISYDYAYQIAHIMQRFGGLAVTGDNGEWNVNLEGNEGYAKFLNMYKDMINNGYNPLEADTDSMASAGQIGMTIGGPWVTYGLDTAGVNYGIGLIPQGDAGDMNSVEVLGFAVTTAASDAEKQAAYKFIEWWNTENAEGSSPALEWSLANGFPAYTYSVQGKDEYKASAKLSAMSAANPDAPTDFIVDSSFPGVSAIVNDVIPEMMNAVAFSDTPIEDVLKNAQSTAEAAFK